MTAHQTRPTTRTAGETGAGAALTCPTCSTPELSHDDVCSHHNPICWTCCFGGEHGWTPMPWEDDAA